MKKETYEITGMTCSACSSRVEKCANSLEGVEKASVNLLTNSMQIEYDEDVLSAEKIVQTVEKAGYGAALRKKEKGVSKESAGSGRSMTGIENAAGISMMQREADSLKKRFLVSIVFLVPLMYISMFHMFYEWFGLPVPGFVMEYFHGTENVITFSFSQFLLLLPIVYVNRKYFIVGFKTLFHGSPNMDSLIAIGSSAAMIYGCFVIFRLGRALGLQDMAVVEQYGMEVYFESAGTILTLITLGKYLEARSKGKTSEAITKLMNLAPKTAVVERDGKEETIGVEEVQEGDIVLVRSGGAIPVDGVIVWGNASIDEAAITGESIPVDKKEGDTVVGATMNKAGFIKFRATRVGDDTTLSQIIRLVEEASASKAPIAKMADKIAGVFVPVVITIAILAAVIWMFLGAGFEFALSIGISVLVISCPCALGLATPVAIMVGTGKGAELGILIKSGEALETAHNIDTVVLDKTGTITEGKPVVTDILAFGRTKEELLYIATGLEKPSEHPLAEAIVKYGTEKGVEEADVTEFATLPGKGVSAFIGDGKYYAGNEALMAEKKISTEKIKKELYALANDGKTPLIFSDENEVLGVIAVADVAKKTSKAAIEKFQKMGIHVIMLTGDNEVTAKAVQRQLNIPKVIAGVLPDRKEQVIAELQKEGRKVAMVGDGINDAPALMRADVGIAIGAGTDIALESADIVLMKNELPDVCTAIRLSRKVMTNIKQNLFWAFFYNSIGIPLAAGVFYYGFGLKLNPMFGSAAMALSSVCVVSNALRIKRFKEDKPVFGKKKADVEMVVEGMSCGHCSARVEEALNGLDGVKAEVNLKKKTAYVTLESEVSDETLKATVENAGYSVTKISR
ncbi:MAG: heavy metal translocating P-type ATPase [Lachnospiraceae bacterium]|nr:heavy metal translocating P-type ATPase [Lachnospiraceae bacterium]